MFGSEERLTVEELMTDDSKSVAAATVADGRGMTCKVWLYGRAG